MTDTESFDGTGDWQRFVFNHGYGASGFDLAAVLQRPIADIARIRATGACSKSRCRKGFADLFRLRHGREPRDDEWPPPEEIVQVLTQRLRDVTGNPTAVRNPTAVQVAINRIGMQSSDVLSGITTAEAGREIGSLAIVNQAIHKGDIRAVRVGRLWVIPHETWKTWKSKRIFPPTGYVPLSKLKGPLSVRSDKLSEFARLGYVANRLIADRRAGQPMP